MKANLTASQKAAQGIRLSFDDAMELYRLNDLLSLAEWARVAKERKTGKKVYYNVNRHINLTNICTANCPLCAFSCKAGDPQGFILSKEEIRTMLIATAKKTPGLTEVHMVSALHPDEPFSYYVDIVKTVKDVLPKVHLKAFTPVEIVHFAQIADLSIEQVLIILKEAGLDSLPGGGAEILDDAVRKIICPNKATTAQWIETIKTAHHLGILTNATMMYGHIETIEQRISHLFTLRDIQDETNGFQAYVSFPFHPANTELSHLKRVSSWEDLKMIALSRLILDNIDHIKAFWMMLTQPIAQLALAFGVDDLDGTVEEEKIIHAAGATTKAGITKLEIIKMVEETGYVPIERDTFYHLVK
jgi:aminodeoxyfutalosine synthase